MGEQRIVIEQGPVYALPFWMVILKALVYLALVPVALVVMGVVVLGWLLLFVVTLLSKEDPRKGKHS